MPRQPLKSQVETRTRFRKTGYVYTSGRREELLLRPEAPKVPCIRVHPPVRGYT